MAIHNKKIFLASIHIVLIGCSTAIIKTSELPTDFSKYNGRIGSVYYLPRALIPISIKLKNSTGSNNSAKPGTANTTPQISNTITINNKAEPTPKPSGKETPKRQYTVEIGTIRYVPDIKHPYFLEYNPSIFSDDNTTIEVGENQLLKTIDATSKDESGNTLVTLVQIAAEAAKLASGIPSFPSDLNEEGQSIEDQPGEHPKKKYFCTPPEDLVTNIYASDDSISALNEKLKKAHLPMKFELFKPESHGVTTPPGGKQSDKVDFIANWWHGLNDGCKSDKSDDDICVTKGVLVRSPLPYTLRVITTTDTADKTEEGRFFREAKAGEKAVNTFQECINKANVEESEQDFFLMPPDGGPITSVDISRTPFVTQKTNVAIVDGMLRKITLDKPSEALGAVQIPLNIVKAVAAIPGSILSVQLKNTQDQASLYKAQADLLTQQMQLLKERQQMLSFGK